MEVPGQNHILDTLPLQNQASYYRGKKYIFSHCQDTNSSSSPQPGHSSNYTIPAQYCKLSTSLQTTICMKQGPWEARSLLPIQEVNTPLYNLSMF